MIVNTREKHPQQAQLLGLESGLPVAACRNWCGDFFEEATVRLFGGRRLGVNSQATICPDIQLGENSFIEAKSIGCGNAAMAYECRLVKDADFMRETSATLYYVLWKHSFRVHDGITLVDLRSGIARATQSATVVAAEAFIARMQAGKLMTLNAQNGERRENGKPTKPRQGYGERGYTTGYRERLRVFQEGARCRMVESLLVYGCETGPIEVYEQCLLK